MGQAIREFKDVNRGAKDAEKGSDEIMDLYAKTRLDHKSIFESIAQYMDDDPATMRPIQDRLLIRDVPDEEFSAGGVVLTAAPSLGSVSAFQAAPTPVVVSVAALRGAWRVAPGSRPCAASAPQRVVRA